MILDRRVAGLPTEAAQRQAVQLVAPNPIRFARDTVSVRVRGVGRRDDVIFGEGLEQAEADHRRRDPRRLNDLYRVWDTQGGLILLLDFQGVRLPSGWEEIEGGDYPPYLRNQEYIVWQGREYAIRRIRRSAGTGALESVQLTQTGFIQNFSIIR